MRQFWLDELTDLGFMDLDITKLFVTAGCYGHAELFRGLFTQLLEMISRNTNTVDSSQNDIINTINNNTTNNITNNITIGKVNSNNSITMQTLRGYCEDILPFAATHGHYEVFKMILENIEGANLTIQDDPRRRKEQSYRNHNNIEIIKMLLEVPTVQQYFQRDHVRMFTHACEIGDVGMAEFLFLGTRSFMQWTLQEKGRAFIAAVDGGDTTVVKFLLGLGGVDVTLDNNSVIKIAIACGRMDIVKLLMEFPNVDPFYSEVCAISDNHFVSAVKEGYLDVVVFFLKRYLHRFDINTLNEMISMGYRAETDRFGIFGSRYNHVKKPSRQTLGEMYKLLLSVDGVDLARAHELFLLAISRGDLELFMRCHKKVEIVKRLVELLVMKSNQVDPHEALRIACNDGRFDLVKILVGMPGVDASVGDNELLRVACRNGFLEIVKVLVACPNVDVGANGFEAVVLAAQNGHREVAEFLLGLDGVEIPEDIKKNVALDVCFVE
ncbi:hypothetical protein HDU76_008218 [Blyttiomyces sp. JEL0837]|nr:hypothetical protein HDU76_008218 [Blyttiomyces sp. JEL0837]